MVTTNKASECGHPFSVFKDAVKKKLVKKERTRYTCPHEKCKGKTFLNLKAHIDVVHRGLHKKAHKPCTYAECKGRLFSNVKKHIDRIHKGIKIVQKKHMCPYESCNGKEVFSLKKHIECFHKGIKAPKKECPYDKCNGKSFTHLKDHIDTVHKGIKKKKKTCQYPECKGKEFICLRRHIRSVHGGDKYKCDECENEYKRKDTLVDHVNKKHNDSYEGRYTCTECNYTSDNSNTIKIHIDAVHKKEKKYKCDQCEMAFLYASVLKNHIQEIHEDKEYICSQCGGYYPYEHSLQKHILYTHDEKRYNCQYCGIETNSKSALESHIGRCSRNGKSRGKKQELNLKNKLSEWGYTIDDEITINAVRGGCIVDTSRYYSRLDFHIVNCTNMILLLECDEHQHRFYEPMSCEFSRMADVEAALTKTMSDRIHKDGTGDMVPIYWIRYSPNSSYKIGGKHTQTRRYVREAHLKEHLERVCSPDFKPDNHINIHYMFYNLVSKEKGLELFNHEEFPSVLLPYCSWHI